MTAPPSPESRLSRAVGESLLSTATLPLRFVLWFPRTVMRIAIPACMFAGLLHYLAGNTGRIPWDMAYAAVCAVVLGVLRFCHERFGI